MGAGRAKPAKAAKAPRRAQPVSGAPGPHSQEEIQAATRPTVREAVKDPGRVKSYFRAALRDEWDGLERINRDLRLADLFTLTNALMGLAALICASLSVGAPADGTAGLGWTKSGYTRLAIQFVLIGVIMDGLDGAVARMGKGNGPLGGVLDTLSDALTFIGTSAMVAFLAMYNELERDWSVGLIILFAMPVAFYLVCGLLRLARFESLRDDGKVRKYFSGIPSPAAAGTLLALVLVNVPWWVVLAAAFYLGVLMTSRVRFPKLRGWGAVATLAVILAVLFTFPSEHLQQLFAWAMLAFMACYVLFGPFFVLARYGPPKSSTKA